MQLDRNTNRGGAGKYALVNMRKLLPLIDTPDPTIKEQDVVACFDKLFRAGIITLGNESPGDQFFVMKYKDKFTAPALQAYAVMAHAEADALNDASLKEFANQISAEARVARDLGNRIPD